MGVMMSFYRRCEMFPGAESISLNDGRPSGASWRIVRRAAVTALILSVWGAPGWVGFGPVGWRGAQAAQQEAVALKCQASITRGEEISSVLGLSVGSRSQEMLSRLLRAPVKTWKRKDLEEMADALTDAADFHAFTIHAYRHITVTQNLNEIDTRGELGSPHERSQLFQALSQLAKENMEDQARRQKYARAAIVLRLLDPFASSPLNNKELFENQDIIRWANLSEKDVQRLMSADRRVEEMDVPIVEDASIHMSLTLGRMIDKGAWNPETRTDYEKIRGWLKRLLDEDAPHPGHVHVELTMAWQLRGLLQSWGRGQEARQVAADLTEAGKKWSHPLVRKWIQEAAELPSSKPDGPAMLVIRSPNDLKPKTGP